MWEGSDGEDGLGGGIRGISESADAWEEDDVEGESTYALAAGPRTSTRKCNAQSS